MKAIFIILSIHFVVFFTGKSAESDTLIMQLQEIANNYYSVSPHQKVYLHTDKAVYSNRENIWIKAYVLNSVAEHPDNFSSNLYVELINPDNEVSEMHRFALKNGFAEGYITLRDTLAEGIYHIRAYTNIMRNRGLEFAFVKSIKLNNENYKYIISPKEARKNRKKIERWNQKVKLELHIHGEGGTLTNGLTNNFVFSAVNKVNDKGMYVKGKVVDENKKVIASFESNAYGMGTFKFTPEKDTKYQVLIEKKKGHYQKFPLPGRQDIGIAMQISKTNTSDYLVEVFSNIPATKDPSVKNLYFLGTANGKAFLMKRFDRSTPKITYVLDNSELSPGIIQLLVTDSKMNILAQRLILVDKENSFEFNVEPFMKDTVRYLRLKPGKQAEDMNLSLAVTTNPDAYPNSSITDEMLYVSEIGKSPTLDFNYLLTEGASWDELDVFLMMNNNYRYEWNRILKGEEPVVQYPPEKGITITGKITTEVFDIPIKQADLKMYVLEKYNDYFTTLSGDKGIFKFDNVYFTDSSLIKIVARKPSGSKNLLIHLDTDHPEIPEFSPKYYFLTTISKRNQRLYRKMKNDEAREEIRRREDELRDYYSNKIAGMPDQIIYGSELNSNYVNVLDAIKGRAAGVSVVGDQVIIRGQNTILGSTEPLYLLDDMPTDVSGIKTVPVESVERIEIYKGPSAASYGVRGANGIISVRTKRGFNIKKGEIEFEMLGYQSPKEFDSHIPVTSCDSKTVAWIPRLEFNDGAAIIELPGIPDECGTLYIRIEGIGSDGQIITSTKSVTVH